MKYILKQYLNNYKYKFKYLGTHRLLSLELTVRWLNN